jgi:hypothetical protein
MSATETQTATSDHPQAPEIKIFTRVASIPIVWSSLESINNVLTNNSFTRQPYAQAKVLSTTAYKLTEPIQVKLAPLILRADGIVNKAVDVVESRYPYPFQAQPQEVASYVRERKNSTLSGVNKAIDDRVKTPAIHVAENIDLVRSSLPFSVFVANNLISQRFAPILDYFEIAVSKFNHPDAGPSTPPDAKYQYQRALALSKTLRGSIFEYSNDQLKHLQAQSVIA